MNVVKYKIGKNSVDLYGYLHERQSVLNGEYDKRPAVIVFPGGGYSYKSKREEDPIVFPLFAHGYNVFVLMYSTSDEIGASYPEEEAAEAIKVLRRDGDALGIVESQIAVLGFSAGGHVAASIACHWPRYSSDARPNAAVLCYPVITMGEHGHQGSTENLTKGDEKLIEYYSLEKQVTENVPPCFIWSTFTDGSVDIWNTLSFAAALHEHKVEPELHIYSQGIHGLSAGRRETGNEEKCVQSWLPLALSFLDRLWEFRL